MSAADNETLVAEGKSVLGRLNALIGTTILHKVVPMDVVAHFIKTEVAGAIDGGAFKGMRDSGPNADNPEEVSRFQSKTQQWSRVMSNLGWASGQFERDVYPGATAANQPYTWQRGSPTPQLQGPWLQPAAPPGSGTPAAPPAAPATQQDLPTAEALHFFLRLHAKTTSCACLILEPIADPNGSFCHMYIVAPNRVFFACNMFF